MPSDDPRDGEAHVTAQCDAGPEATEYRDLSETEVREQLAARYGSHGRGIEDRVLTPDGAVHWYHVGRCRPERSTIDVWGSGPSWRHAFAAADAALRPPMRPASSAAGTIAGVISPTRA